MNLIGEDSHLLIELDCLLDTRLGTLALLDEEAAAGLLGPRYTTRASDNWSFLTHGKVSNEAFAERYRARDHAVLEASRPTDLIAHLQPMLRKLEQNGFNEPVTQDLTLQINYYPYVLSAREQHFIAEVMSSHYSAPYTTIEMVSIPPEALTPKRLRDEYSLVVVYDFNQWLGLHIEALAKQPTPATYMVAPALDATLATKPQVFYGVDTPVQSNPFAALELFMAEFIALAIHPVAEFSLIDLSGIKHKPQEG